LLDLKIAAIVKRGRRQARKENTSCRNLGFDLATQRRFELQADALSLQTMAQTGFDPQGLVQYIERDQMVPTDARPAELSPLPPRDQRVAAMTAVIQGLEGASYAARADVEFGAAREEVHRSVLPKNSAPPSLRHKQP
jgi:predicted Zn-dependent protease